MQNIISDNMREFMKQEDRDREGTAARIKYLVENPGVIDGLRTGRLDVAQATVFLVTYDQSLGLRALIKRAVGSANFCNVSTDITQERFKLAGTCLRKIKARVEPCLAGESYEQAVARFKNHVPGFGNTGDLVEFLHDHPDEVEKWAWVAAVSEDSRWTVSDDSVFVPYVFVSGANRFLNLDNFRSPQDSSSGVLILCE